MNVASRAAFRPDNADSLGKGAVLAVLAHLVLVVALTFGVNWKTHNPVVAEAEIWAELPQIAAPPPPPPPPMPVQEPAPAVQEPPAPEPVADIPSAPQPKLKKKERKDKPRPPVAKVEPKPLPKPKKAREPREVAVTAPPVATKAEPPVATPTTPALSWAQREAQRKANLARMMNNLGSMGTSARSAGPSSSANYRAKITARIVPNIVFTGVVNGQATTFVEIRCAPDGRILSHRLLDSSGVAAWDGAVMRAIERTDALPLDDNGRLPDTVFQIGISPGDR
ncbi:MAG: TonB C-terminal domain-containing protein [Burkholderiales bacterium]|nr:TonB C-terminal domain-containing protein [Burkholderiales bacterium]